MQATDVHAIEQVLEKQEQAMVAGDLNGLKAILSEQFTATHITGYVQPRAEWLSQIQSGYFRYHRVTPQSSAITVNGTQATAVRRSVVDVTIGGSRGRWPLESTTQLVQQSGQWTIVHSRATTY